MTASQLMKFASKFMIADIKMAFEDRKSVLDSNWIYAVDPETMGYVKAAYNEASDNCSLYQVFCYGLN